MKTILFFLVIVLIAQAKQIKNPNSAAAPQWNCGKVTSFNNQAQKDEADATKCSYLEYLRNEMASGYKAPTYPACFAQMDLQCTDKIANYRERGNIRIFSTALQVYCEDGAQWEDFRVLLETFQGKFAEAFTTDYWNCVHDQAAEWETAQYVPSPYWYGDQLDILNFVCQNTLASLRNVERIAYQEFFNVNGWWFSTSYENQALGKNLFQVISDLFSADTTLTEELRNCMVAEIGYFIQSIIPQVKGKQNLYDNAETGFDQAYLVVGENNFVTQDAWYDEAAGGYECWNFYSPAQHYHETTDDVAETAFDGNRGHPSCPENTMFQPLSIFGPICCPIHPSTERPHTYDCCQDSVKSYQISQVCQTVKTSVDRKQFIGPKGFDYAGYRAALANATTTQCSDGPLPSTDACFGCTCLEGFSMSSDGDFWEGQFADKPHGACLPKDYSS